MLESIKDNGLLEPFLVRPTEEGRYELISGHRRKLALELLGYKEAECYVEELTDDEATIKMVDSNNYRNIILPSEKAFAYKMKLEAIKHQGKKKQTSTQSVSKLSASRVGKANNDSREKVRRYIRLTELIPELLKLVDDAYLCDRRTSLVLSITTAVELSYLSKDIQKLIWETIDYEQTVPNRAQAIRIRYLAEKKKIDFDVLEKILCEEKGNQHEKISFNKEKITSVLPPELLKRDKRYIEEYIIEAIRKYRKI